MNGLLSVVCDAETQPKEQAAEAMNEGISLYGSSLQAAMESAGTLSFGGEQQSTGLVAVALGEFAQGTERDAAFLPLRASNSANGAVEATNAYLAGDTEQAWNAQHQASLAPDVTAFLEAARKRAGDSK
ncbi:hypothetical protein SSP24_74370 [Streptomyces spinoverrucosus]|uniref:Uncharacterized protein n=1 Tax=Streptomyces spinoverrucosus TaxID=284043 RepID=A0A4Y3VRX8_9ACTN|nr:DUF6507 family protein [Streptomyces spinoverrucosus]GEC09782.1 hypothetical protein SSP24_74370 [Streptomyces spinoverrucosus]GHB52332.1 hypothetical protein GCM10010397_22760 [Streptomyces spinoverrucosus]